MACPGTSRVDAAARGASEARGVVEAARGDVEAARVASEARGVVEAAREASKARGVVGVARDAEEAARGTVEGGGREDGVSGRRGVREKALSV